MKTYKDALDSKDLALSAELFLHTRSNQDEIREQTDMLSGHVDGVLVTDNQSGQLHMSSLAASLIVRDGGIDPIMQLGCRNRNRIAVLGDLLGAGALGIRSLQLVRGERVPDGFEPRPKAVLDISATELLATATQLTSEEGVGDFHEFHLGGVITAHAPKDAWRPRKLLQKIDAGAHFLMTHTCMDLDLLRAYMQHLVSLQVLHRVRIIATIAVLRSVADARWLRNNKPNVLIPKGLVSRLDRAADPRAEGIALCAEQLRELADIPGLSGVHLYNSADMSAIPEAIVASGVRQ